jgi:hypothetical protein
MPNEIASLSILIFYKFIFIFILSRAQTFVSHNLFYEIIFLIFLLSCACKYFYKFIFIKLFLCIYIL